MSTALDLAKVRLRLASLFRGLNLDITDGDHSVCADLLPDGIVRLWRGEKSQSLPIWDIVALARLGMVSLRGESLADQSEASLSALRQAMHEAGWLDQVSRRAPDIEKPGSARAARVVAKIRGGQPQELHKRVLAAFEHAGDYGLTDIELDAELVNDTHKGSTWRTRRAELVSAGLIADSDATRRVAGRRRTVWKLARYVSGEKEPHPDQAVS